MLDNKEESKHIEIEESIDIWCLSPAKKYKLYKSSINKSIHLYTFCAEESEQQNEKKCLVNW